MRKLMAIIKTVFDPKGSMQSYDERVYPVKDAVRNLSTKTQATTVSARNYSATLLRKGRAESHTQQRFNF